MLAGLDVDGARLVLEQPVAAYGERLLGGGLLLGLGLGLGLELGLGLGFVSSAVACSASLSSRNSHPLLATRSSLTTREPPSSTVISRAPG